MKKIILIIALFFIVLMVVGGNLLAGRFLVGSFFEEEKEIKFDRTLTKAICEKNTCRDFLVYCRGNEVLEMEPISGFVTFGGDWVDLRGESRGLC